MSLTIKPRWSVGKLLISLVALFTAGSPYLADWNETHIYNPLWLPHAKFHNAQTMVLGALLGLLAIYCLWLRREISDKQKLNEATILASLYWLAQLPATLFPGTALTDPGVNHVRMPVVFGIELNQVIVVITVIFGQTGGKVRNCPTGVNKLTSWYYNRQSSIAVFTCGFIFDNSCKSPNPRSKD